MTARRFPALQTRIDAYSYQVSNAADPKFWFRIERTDNVDVITDYSLGTFPKERGGDLLAECYRVVGLTPRMTIVFRNIAPGNAIATDAQAVTEARNRYGDWGRALLIGLGADRVRESLEENRGKYDLRLTGER
jgi:hypothetical protein